MVDRVTETNQGSGLPVGIDVLHMLNVEWIGSAAELRLTRRRGDGAAGGALPFQSDTWASQTQTTHAARR
eukprot:3012432-Rhodomonas_salina.4